MTTTEYESSHVLSGTQELKTAVRAMIEQHRETWLALSHDIHDHPELAFEEFHAAALVAETLAGQGFDVQHPAHELETAVMATSGAGGLRVSLCAEYDALPEIGHACGHNIIAASSVAAACALRTIAEEAGLTVDLVGTPAEEDGGGKIMLARRGAFDGSHLALMAHPAPFDVAAPSLIAATQFHFEFDGKSAHAAAGPDQAINAADAANLAQISIGLLRQHLPASVKVHGIVTEAGTAPNVIPAHSSGEYVVRAQSQHDLDHALERVEAAFRGAAIATGCTLRLTYPSEPYPPVTHDLEIAGLYQRNAERLGRTFATDEEMNGFTASTDMGEVSNRVPTIHPLIQICGTDVLNHQPAFTEASAGPGGDSAVIDAAVALAWTVIDAATNPRIRSRLLGSTD